MRRFSRHVGVGALARTAADEAGDRERRRVLGHLESCAVCRARYQWVRALPAELEAATRPPLPEGFEDRVLAARARGRRVILPVRDRRPAPRDRSRYVGGFAAAGLVLVASTLLWLALRGTAEADLRGGELSLSPAAPHPGDVLELAYRPSRELRGAARLVVRGVVTPPVTYETPPPLPRRLAVLDRDEDVYRGTFALPEDAVYAQLVVESMDGSAVDDHDGRRWHVEVQAENRPSRDALRAHQLLADDWEEGFEATRRATELYPGDPRLQAARLSAELGFLTRAERDSAIAAHRSNFERIAGDLTSRESLGPEQFAGLVEYARVVGDTAAARHCIALLEALYPTHPETLWYRVPATPSPASREAVAAYLASLEDLWREAGPHPAIASRGFWAARELRDEPRIMLWARRALAAPMWRAEPGEVALDLAEIPTVRDSAAGFLRAAIRRLDGADGERRLGRTVAEQRARDRIAMRPLLVALAGVLEDRGARAAALDTLRVAAAIGWSPEVHARLAAAELANGDSAAAAASLARAAAVRFRGDGPAIDLSTGPALVGREEWEILERRGRDEMLRRVLARSTDLPLLADPVWVFDAGGARHDLDELRHGTVLVVALWDPRNGAAVRALPDLRRIAYVTRALGGELVMVTRTPPDDRTAALLGEHEFAAPLYHDLDRRVSRALESAWTPSYYVLGLGGRVRFADTPLDDVLSEVDALLAEPRLVVAEEE